jgi:excisionase family DNA binding protein
MDKIYVKLCELAEITGLPKATIKRLAVEGKIPALKLSQGFRFNPAEVRQALARLSATEKQRQRPTLLSGGTGR